MCGSDGKTYSNKCALEVADCKDKSTTITVVSHGECPSQPGYGAGSGYSSPGGGSGAGDSYSSPTTQAPKPVYGAYGAPGGSYGAPCPDACPAVFDPVCGSDGITYSNQCALEVADCKDTSTTITVVSKGKCQSHPGYGAGNTYSGPGGGSGAKNGFKAGLADGLTEGIAAGKSKASGKGNSAVAGFVDGFGQGLAAAKGNSAGGEYCFPIS